MTTVHPHRTSIDPVAEGTPRPRWSIMIPTFNCARYLEEALGSVLAQDQGPELMQIEIVDDYSTVDDPEAVVAKLGRGRASFFRQPRNIGVPANLTACIQRSKGLFIHLLHGDDAVRWGFYEAMQHAFHERRNLGAAYCRNVFIDNAGTWLSFSELEQPQSGLLTNALESLALEQRIMTPSICVRRKVYEHLGGFDNRLSCSEDWEMWVRIAAAYPIWYEKEPLALYRVHDNTNTGRNVRTGNDVTYNARAIEIMSHYLPPHRAHVISERARATYAVSALGIAERAFAGGNYATGLAQLRGALKLSWAPSVLGRALLTLVRPLIVVFRGLFRDFKRIPG